MTGTIRLRPGTPDDDNRHYLPEALKHSDLVVNENGNNSQPYPPLLREHREVLVDGVEDTWYTYVPESYDPRSPTPLVLSLHGGLMTGWGQAVYSSWTAVADREGLVVVFPDAGRRRFWTIDIAPERVPAITEPNDAGLYLNAPPSSPDDNHDLLFLRALIERTAQEYAIDRERVFMHGMSMGDAMTSQFARWFGEVLAGAAGSGAPVDPALLFAADGALINRAGPLPVWQSRLDLDVGPTHFSADIPSVVVANRDYWLRVDGVSEPPAIAVRGRDNFAFYRGDEADVVFRDVHDRDHGQTFDDAELVWDLLFSGCRRRADGSIAQTEGLLPRRGDAFAVALAVGRASAWVSGRTVALTTPVFPWSALQYHGRGGDALVRSTHVYAPLDFIAHAFDARLRIDEPGTAHLTLADGRELQFARGGIGVVLDGRVTAMFAEAVERDGTLCIPIGWFATHVLDLRASEHSGVIYITDHHAELSGNMARLLSDLLAG